MARQLSQDDLALVVKRAAELHVAGAGDAPDTALDENTAYEVLREAGLSEQAARQALAEWQHGSLSAHGVLLPAPDPKTRLEPTASVARQLPIPPERMADVFDALVRRQYFTRGRRIGLGGDWLPRNGLWADVRRKLDFSGKLVLKDINRLRLEVRSASGGNSRVTVTADVSTYRGWIVCGLVGVPAATALGLGLGGIAEGSIEMVLVGTPLAALAAGGGYQGAGYLLERRRERVREALDIVLDRLA
jgi:hypothetical protein